jgi:hypothetical protein
MSMGMVSDFGNFGHTVPIYGVACRYHALLSAFLVPPVACDQPVVHLS